MTRKNNFELTRRKALAGIGAIGAASVGAGLGTTAYFSDQETFEDNAMVAGELDLRVDWQQTYHGMAEDHRQAPYGSAGRPFVSAHPDHDDDGMQSIDSDEFDSVDDDGVVAYEDNDANIQEYLTCETLANFDDPDDFGNDNENYEPEALIDLADVKPGDCGEVTFSYHLCDNPGYVWLLGQAEEMPEELAEALQVRVWYDLDCSNEVDPEDRIIFEWGSMRDVLGSELDGELLLQPQYYDPAYLPPEETESNSECLELGKTEWDGSQFVVEDGDDVEGPIETGTTDNDEDYFVLEFSVDGDAVPVKIIVLEYDDGDPQEVYFTLENEFEDRVVAGFCLAAVKGGPITSNYADGGGCVREVTDVEVTRPPDDDRPDPAISNITFYYCPLEAPEPDLCFPPDETYCIGFEWCLPVDVDVDDIDGIDDVNDLQGQQFSFDLGFYTEQCRHNDEPGQTFAEPEE